MVRTVVLLAAVGGTALVAHAAMPLLPQRTAPAPVAGSAGGEIRLTSVTQQSIADAVRRARAALAAAPGSRQTIVLPAGSFDLSSGGTGVASIDLSRIDACPGMLTITGQGMDRTTITTDEQLVGIMGRGASCITIADLTMTRAKIEATQGTVVSATRDSVTIDIPRGFPDPTSLLPATPELGRNGQEVIRRWLKAYRPSPDGPQIIVDQQQANWRSAERVPGGPNRWRFDLVVRGMMPTYRPGDLIGVKSKSGLDAYRFINGEKITFRGVRWMMETRGVFRMVNNVTIQDCVIQRPPPINGVRFALASSSGGPQIGQPSDPMTEGHVVTGNRFEATGDDALLFAHANGVVRDNRISDTFGSAIRIYESPGLTVGQNLTLRAPILHTPDGQLERPNNVRRGARGERPDDY